MKKLDWKRQKHINFKKIMSASKKQKLKYLFIFLAGGAWISSMTLGIASFTLSRNSQPRVKQGEVIEKDNTQNKDLVSLQNKDVLSAKSFTFLMDDDNANRKFTSQSEKEDFYHLEKDYDEHDFIYILRDVENKDNYKINLMWFKSDFSEGLKQIFSWDESRFLNDFVLRNQDNKEIKLFFEWIQDVKTKKWSLILKRVENDQLGQDKSFMFNLKIEQLAQVEIEKENELRKKLQKLDHVYFWTIVDKNKLPSEVASDPITKERIKKLVCIKRIKDYEIKLESDDEFGNLYLTIENHGFVKPIKLRGFQTTYERNQQDNNDQIKAYLNSSNVTKEINDKLTKTSLPSAIASDLDTINKIKSASTKLANLKTEDIIIVPNDVEGSLEIIFIIGGEERKIKIDNFQQDGSSPSNDDLTTAINALTATSFSKINNLNKLPSEIAKNVAYKNLIKSIPGLNSLDNSHITLKGDDEKGELEIKIKDNSTEKVIVLSGLKTKAWKKEREELLKDFKALNIPEKIEVFTGAEDKIAQKYDDALKAIQQAQQEIRNSFDNAIIKDQIKIIKDKINEIASINQEQIDANFDYQLTTLGNDEKMPSHILKDLESRILNFKNIGTPIKKEDISVVSFDDNTGELKIRINNFRGSQEFQVPNVLTKKAWKLKLFSFIKPKHATLFKDSIGRLWLAQENTRLKVLKPGEHFWQDVPGEVFENGKDVSFFEDSNKNVWVMSYWKPTYVLFNGEEKWEKTFYKNNPSKEVSIYYESIPFEDNKGNIWGIINNDANNIEDGNIIRWSPAEKAWEIFMPSKKIMRESVFVQDWNNTLYVANDVLYRIDLSKKIIEPVDKNKGNKIFDGLGARLFKTSHNDLYAMGNDSSDDKDSPLQVLKNGQHRWQDATGSMITDGQYGLLFEDSFGNIWAAGVRSKLYVLKDGNDEWEEARNSSNVVDGKFSVMFEDSNKTLWIIGRDSQLQYKQLNEPWKDYDKEKFSFYFEGDELGPDKNKPWFYEDEDGDIWFWMQDKGISLLEKV